MQKLSFKHCHESWGRGYIINKTMYPGVGSVLSMTKPLEDKMALINWKKSLGDEADKVSKDALDRGSNWHKYLECINAGDIATAEILLKTIPSNNEIAKHSRGLIKRLQNIKVVASEFPVCSNKLGYAGTFDCLVSTEKELILLDWKTSSKIKESKYVKDYYLQLAAYSNAITECYGLNIEKAFIVVFYTFKTPDYFPMDKELLKESFELFAERVKEFYKLIKSEQTPSPI
jgi:genome maintenance exonuclease 1